MTTDEVEMFNRLQDVANQKFDGHFTIMKFTTNWRVSFGTPHDGSQFGVRDYIDSMSVGLTFYEAAQNALEAAGK
jgi:hypothetical protein